MININKNVSGVCTKVRTCKILGIDIAVTNMKEVVEYIEKNINNLRGKYISVCNGHTSVMAYEDAEYGNIQKTATLALPDGEPLSIVSRKRGYQEAERVTGPDLMEEMFHKAEAGDELRHFFYGGTQDTLDKLKQKLEKKYPNMQIAGMYSPPFRALTEEEDIAAIEMLNDSRADIIWVGLGAPKQERWMYEHRGKLNGVSIGVGAGFDYHAGKLKRAPKWMQENSMEWFFRLIQDPERLWKRYLVTNIKFVYYIIKENKDFRE